tara:strand:+ start:1336 stop:2016 length:681 start_codon:yes stop_codon:yes gene_type:complete
MKSVWLFGGSTKPFGKTIINGFENIIRFGRHNVDYSNIDRFIHKVENDPVNYPIPDLIIFNISNNGHEIDLKKIITPDRDIELLIDMIKTTFSFQLRLTEWFFLNHSKKRLLFLTSNEPNNIFSKNNNQSNQGDANGNLMLYRMSRSLEHQIIHQQNILKHNITNKNIIMGICVGNNPPKTVEWLNHLIINDSLKRGMFSTGFHSDHTGRGWHMDMVATDIGPKLP